MINEIEYVDPETDKCPECACSFGVHLMTCSNFYQCPDCRTHNRENHFGGCSQRKIRG